jgi:hypothetical protein
MDDSDISRLASTKGTCAMRLHLRRSCSMMSDRMYATALATYVVNHMTSLIESARKDLASLLPGVMHTGWRIVIVRIASVTSCFPPLLLGVATALALTSLLGTKRMSFLNHWIVE